MGSLSGAVLAAARICLVVLAAAYLAAIIASAGFTFIGSARQGWAAFLRELLLPLLFPAPVLFGAAVLLRARVTAFALLAPCLAGVWLLSPQSIWVTPVAPAATGFRIMTLNVGAARRLEQPDRVILAVEANNPDIVCLVEVSEDAHWRIGDPLLPSFPYQMNRAGVVVLSRFPLLDARDLDISGMKGSLQVTVEVGDRPVSVTTAHLQRVDGYRGIRSGVAPLLRTARGFSTAARDDAITDLITLLKHDGGTRVLVGDFNMTPTSHAHDLLTREFRDAHHEAGAGPGLTYPTTLRSVGLNTSLPLLRIDYIFHSPDLVSRRAWVGADGGSDHFPVVADLSFH